MLLIYQYFSFESVHDEARLKMGWVVKKYIFKVIKLVNGKLIYLAINIY